MLRHRQLARAIEDVIGALLEADKSEKLAAAEA